MDNREILERFKKGELARGQATALLAGAAPVPPRPTCDSAPAPGPRPAPRPAPPAPREERHADDGCAIVGIGGKYPRAAGLDDFWRDTLAGHRGDRQPAVGRGDDDAPQPGHALDGIDGFDPAFFGITDEEGALMDPQERLFLETAWQTLEEAGYLGGRLDTLVSAAGREPRSVGVFAAVSSHDYALLAASRAGDKQAAASRAGEKQVAASRAGEKQVAASRAGEKQVAASRSGEEQAGELRSGHRNLPDRLTRVLGLRGPCQAVDTGDSSFLVALHHALAALRAGECAAALVGAVELRLHPSRQRAEDGEGVGMVLLRPLARARADGDTVHAIVRSSTVGGLPDVTCPDAAAVGLPDVARPDAAAVHESKETVAAAVGDAGAAVGAAALTRAVLQLREGTLAPVAEGDSAVPWTGGAGPRRASVTVCGAGGRSARVVLEEHLLDVPTAPEAAHLPDREELILLSAPSPAHLSATAALLAAALHEHGPRLPAVAHALRAGRAQLRCRLAVTARTTEELAAALDAFSQGRDTTPSDLRVVDLQARSGEPLLPAGATETRDYLAALWRANRTRQLTRLWLAGVDVCTAQGGGPSVELPGAAFLRRRLWIGSGR